MLCFASRAGASPASTTSRGKPHPYDKGRGTEGRGETPLPPGRDRRALDPRFVGMMPFLGHCDGVGQVQFRYGHDR